MVKFMRQNNIAKAMIKVGKLLSKGPIVETEKKPNQEVRTFKFGELQVAVTPEKAFIGAVIAAAFGLLSWELSQGIQNIPDSSFQYANDNAVILAKSLRGALLVLGYSSTVLSAFVLVGLLLLGRQLSSESNSNEQLWQNIGKGSFLYPTSNNQEFPLGCRNQLHYL
ncbi:hypothetical protein HPP92_008825 [Vanilla planifolia]|uniref:Uncharacterized protein n=1 Tax=Vanilla planifolia TaxID=51239 RepID=A0A835V7K9_VANPL|nr:hypothetical protein HPP92_009057 [Vanilla planifolia]KAG0486730.1 hypothetical protein HPP92_008825 [Vanilla planifolia]